MQKTHNFSVPFFLAAVHDRDREHFALGKLRIMGLGCSVTVFSSVNIVNLELKKFLFERTFS